MIKIEKYENYLYSKPVFRVEYGAYHLTHFELKTIKGCKRRIEREGIEDYAIYEIEKHYCDDSQDRKKIVMKSPKTNKS